MFKKQGAVLIVVIFLGCGLTAFAQRTAHMPKRLPDLSKPRLYSKSGTSANQAAAAHAKAIENRFSYRGTTVVPHDNALGEELKLQKEISVRLSAFDFVPQKRVAHLRWLVDRSNQTIIGWKMEILGTQSLDDGIHVSTKVRPVLENGGFATGDFTLEEYVIQDGGIRQVGFEVAPPFFSQFGTIN